MNPVIPRSGEGRPTVFAADQPQYRPLPARVTEEGAISTEWELTAAERKAVADGARVQLRVLTFGGLLQPVLLTVEGVDPGPELPAGLDT